MTAPVGGAGGPLVKVAGAAAAAVAGWMVKSSFDGASQHWEQRNAAAQADMQMQYNGINWASWSGEKGFDGLATQVQTAFLKGFMGLNLPLTRLRNVVEGAINEVLIKNLVPLTVAGLAVWAGFHKEISGAVQWVGRQLTTYSPSILKPVGEGLLQLAKWGVQGLGMLTSGAGKLIARGGWGSVALAGVLGFGVWRFSKVTSGDEQLQRFQNYLANGND